MLNVLTYVRAKFKEAALLGLQDAVNEFDPVASLNDKVAIAKPNFGSTPAQDVPPPPALTAAVSTSPETAEKPAPPAPVTSVSQKIMQTAAAIQTSPNTLAPSEGASAARRDKRPRGE